MIVRLILIVIAVLLGLVVVNWFWQFLLASDAKARRERTGAAPRTGEPMVRDPLCGMYLPKSSALSADIDGRTHYFCSRQCADQYREREAVAGRR
ncbi:MAG TPA: YHS domain-containing protein [Nitrospiria bacterium]|nr:YHS domain-containing protein [Nitrospiria bacterium]